MKKKMVKSEQENEILHQMRAETKNRSPYSQQQNRLNL